MDRHKLVSDLEEYCSPSNDSLSLVGLRERLGHVSALQTSTSHFFHELCSNKNVTLEMAECVLDFNPYVAHFCSNRYHAISYDEDDIRDLSESEAENGGSPYTPESGKLCSDRAYPIHVACANECCPDVVVELLARSNPSALGHLCILETDPYDDCYEGVPLHYYLTRSSNMELETVKMLIDADPRSLSISGEEVKWFPIHAIINNPQVGRCCDFVQHMIKLNPSSLQFTDMYEQVPLHVACYSKHMTANVVQLLVDGWSDSTQQRDCNGCFPIHHLCENVDLDETIKLDILRILVDTDPDTLKATNERLSLPIHIASTYQNASFNKVLVDACPESLRVRDQGGNLPFHRACERGSLDTVEFLFEAEPQSIFATTGGGLYPLHMAMTVKGKCQTGVAQFLLRHDPGCGSKPVTENVPGGSAYIGFVPGGSAYIGFLPLHLACLCVAEMSTVKLLFDENPRAMCRGAKGRIWPRCRVPRDVARASGHIEAANFLEEQANQIAASATQTPIQTAILNVATLGVIKMISDEWPDCISAHDSNQNSSLHCACREGRYDVVNYLLEMKTGLVSEKNGDGKLPIELLPEAMWRRDSLECAEAIWRLLVAHPESVCLLACS